MDLNQKWNIEDGLKSLIEEVYLDDQKKMTCVRTAILDLCILAKNLKTNDGKIYDYQITEIENTIHLLRKSIGDNCTIGNNLIPVKDVKE